MVSDIDDWISKSGPDDVRWEKVENIKRILTGGTCPVPPEQVAAKLLEHMREPGFVNLPWKRRRSSNKTNFRSGVGKATIAGKVKQTI